MLVSNTVMAVVPDLNRISFSSTQLTTFQTVSSLGYSVFVSVYHISPFFAREISECEILCKILAEKQKPKENAPFL